MALTKNEQPAAVSLAGNPMWVDYSTDKGSEDFIGLHLSVSAYLNAAYSQLGSELRYEPDSDSKVQVDLQSLLEWDPEKEFSWPEKTNQIMTKRNDLRRLFKINTAEKYGNPLAQNATDEITDLYVLPGKISDIEHGILNDNNTSWWAQQQTSTLKKFLTNAPREKITDAWASERLYYFVDADPYQNRVRLMITIKYTDGAYDVVEREVMENVNQYDVIEVITSFSTLGLLLQNQSKIIDSYSVRLVESHYASMSEVITYKMDHIRKDNTRYFIFSNAHKMYDGVRLTGSALTKVSNQFQEAGRSLSKGYSVSDPSMIKSNPMETEIIETSSEWLDKDQITWFRELLLSMEVYEIVNGQLIPVQIITTDNSINEDNSNLRAIKIAYKYGHKDRVPTSIPEVIDELDTFTDEQIEITDMTSSSESGLGFDSFTYDENDYSFVSQEYQENHGHAYSNNLSVMGIPLLLEFWNISEYYTHNDLKFTLTPDDDIQDHGLTIELEYRQELGFGPLIINEDSSKLVLFEEEEERENQISGNFRLYIATKRYLEYLYENQ